METEATENLTEEHKKNQNDEAMRDHFGDGHIITAGPHSIPKFNIFKEFINSSEAKKGSFGRVPSEPTLKSLKELFENYNRINSELLEKEKEKEKALQFLASVNDSIRETESKIRQVKDAKNKALDLSDSKKLLEANAELEGLEYRLRKLQSQQEPLLGRQNAINADISFFREKIILPKRYFLRAVLEDLKARIISKTEKELRTIVAIGEMIPGEVRLGNIFNDIDFGKIDAGVIVNEVIQTYAKEFQKEGK